MIDDEIAEAIAIVSGSGETRLNDLIVMLFSESTDAHGLSHEAPISEREMRQIALGLSSYIARHDCDISFDFARGLIGEQTISSHEFARWFSKDLLGDAELGTGPNVRTRLALWLVAILIRGQYCAGEAMELSAATIFRFIRKSLSVLTSDEVHRTLYLLNRIFSRYDGYTDEALEALESLRSDRQRPL